MLSGRYDCQTVDPMSADEGGGQNTDCSQSANGCVTGMCNLVTNSKGVISTTSNLWDAKRRSYQSLVALLSGVIFSKNHFSTLGSKTHRFCRQITVFAEAFRQQKKPKESTPRCILCP